MSLRMHAVRLVIRLKLAAQRLGVGRQADVYVGCAGEWRYPSFLLPALRLSGLRRIEVRVEDAVLAWSADGRRNFLRMGWAALRTPRIGVLSLLESNSGIFGINALHVLRDPFWIERLSHAFRGIAELGLVPHVGKVFPATQVADAHAP